MAKHILVIDDDVAICEALKEILAELGYEVSCAATAQEALSHVHQADLVICDLMLGIEDGLTVIDQLKACKPHLKVIVLSGNPSIDALQRSIDLGVMCFLTKPTKWSELLDWVARSFGEEPLRVLLVPSRLKETLGPVVHCLGDILTADPHDWWLVRTQLRERAPSCVMVDVSAAETADFFNACQTELGECCLFLVCREEDFFVARQLVSRFPTARCLSIESSPAEVVGAIRAALEVRRKTSERVREAVLEDLGRCIYAMPFHSGYYCTVSSPCPFGQEKVSVVTIKGKDYDRCPKRPFPIKGLDRVGLLSWHGNPDHRKIVEYRVQAMELLQQGKTHIVIDCQGLESVHFNLFEVLADIRDQLADKTGAQIDVINLPRRLLEKFQKTGHHARGVQFHGAVMVEIQTSSSLLLA